MADLHAQLAALRTERDGYLRYGKTDKAKLVEAEIARVEKLIAAEPAPEPEPVDDEETDQDDERDEEPAEAEPRRRGRPKKRATPDVETAVESGW